MIYRLEVSLGYVTLRYVTLETSINYGTGRRNTNIQSVLKTLITLNRPVRNIDKQQHTKTT
jgi:hypothetical protein